MNQELCQATVVFVGIGKDGKIKCYLAKQLDLSSGQTEFRATAVASKIGGNSDAPTINSEGHKGDLGFKTFEEAARWLEERCEEFSPLIELHLAPKK